MLLFPKHVFYADNWFNLMHDKCKLCVDLDRQMDKVNHNHYILDDRKPLIIVNE